MSNEEQQEQDPVEFELSVEDLEAIAQGKSKVVPDLPPNERTPFTIENAPMAKSILPQHAFEYIPTPEEQELLQKLNAIEPEPEEEQEQEQQSSE